MDSKSFLYKSSPGWLQDVFITLQGLRFETQRVSRKLALQHYNFLIESQFWSKEQINEYQNLMLRDILREAFENVPYYKSLAKKTGINYHEIRTQDDLAKLPVLTKKDVRGNEHLFVNSKYDIKSLRQSSTSGSTGTPMKLFGIRQNFSKRWAFELRLRNWAGLSDVYHPRRAQFTGRDIITNKNSVRQWRYNYAANALLLSTSDIRKETVKNYAAALERWNPEFIDGYPSVIAVIAKLSLENNIKLPTARAVRVSAETLFDEDRHLIEAAFNCRVFNQYGSSESSCFCSDNGLGQMLVHPEYGIFEVLKQDSNEPAAFAEEGRVITTAFVNPVMPLIRYQLGDLVVRSSEKATSKAGAAFDVLEKVTGRMDDILFIEGVGYLGRLDPVFKNTGGIMEAQIILESKNQLKINFVPASDFSEGVLRDLETNLRKKVGNNIALDFCAANAIPRGANGKFKAVIDNTRSK